MPESTDPHSTSTASKRAYPENQADWKKLLKGFLASSLLCYLLYFLAQHSRGEGTVLFIFAVAVVPMLISVFSFAQLILVALWGEEKTNKWLTKQDTWLNHDRFIRRNAAPETVYEETSLRRFRKGLVIFGTILLLSFMFTVIRACLDSGFMSAQHWGGEAIAAFLQAFGHAAMDLSPFVQLIVLGIAINFVIIGALFIVPSLPNKHRFGEAPLELSRYPIVLGEELHARIQLRQEDYAFETLEATVIVGKIFPGTGKGRSVAKYPLLASSSPTLPGLIEISGVVPENSESTHLVKSYITSPKRHFPFVIQIRGKSQKGDLLRHFKVRVLLAPKTGEQETSPPIKPASASAKGPRGSGIVRDPVTKKLIVVRDD